MELTRGTEKVIRALLKAKNKKSDVWQLSRECGYLPDVIHSVEWLENMRAVDIQDGMIHLKDESKLPRYIFKKERPLKDVMKKYENFRKQVVFENDNNDYYDQLSLLPSAIKNKLSFLLRENDLINRDILCLGDDDLFSVACSLTELPKSITVFDADERVVNFLNEISPRLPVPIKAIKLDLLRPLPADYQNSFDVFVTEPPHTVKGILLFVSRGVQALRKTGVLYLGVPEMVVNKEQWLQIEQAITKAGITFTDIVQNFEESELEGNAEFGWKGFDKLPKWVTQPAQEPWYVSTLLRGEIAGQKKPIHFSFRATQEEIVTDHLPSRT